MIRLSLPLSAFLVMSCAPAIPPRPELPPVTADAAPLTEGAVAESAAPAIPKPDLTSVGAEVKSKTQRTGGR